MTLLQGTKQSALTIDRLSNFKHQIASASCASIAMIICVKVTLESEFVKLKLPKELTVQESDTTKAGLKTDAGDKKNIYV